MVINIKIRKATEISTYDFKESLYFTIFANFLSFEIQFKVQL